MSLSLLQLNIFANTFWDKLSSFLGSSDFDILQFQEVAGKGTVCGAINSKRDCLKDLQTILGKKYNYEFVLTDRFTSSPSAYIGNATFYKKSFSLVDKHIVTLHHNEQPFPSDATSFETMGKSVLHLTLTREGKTFSVLNTHGAWAKTPQEEPHQTRQGQILVDYLQTVPAPFVFSGDLNLAADQPTIQKLSTLGNNLITQYHITNTLNPRTHRAKLLFPQGVTVDYIFTSKDLKLIDFRILEDDISDHFGLTVTIEI